MLKESSYRRLGRTGLNVSPVCLGTDNFANPTPEDESARIRDLNNQLAAASVIDSDAAVLWMHYLDRWTMWNHVRTAAALVASLLFTLGFVQVANA